MGKSQIKPVQKRIVIASILKPVDDTRMFEKMAVSLATSSAFDIHVIGFPSRYDTIHKLITIHRLAYFARISFGRLTASLQVLWKILQVKPELLIINTHELLIVALLNRILFGTKIVYDIQENYYRNLLHTRVFTPFIKPILALWVRAKETATAPFFQGFLLAEKGYEQEMTFFRKNYAVIENKTVVPEGFRRNVKSDDNLHLLFSGTLADATGVFDAIDLVKRLHLANGKITLKIIGYCAQYKTLSRIKETIKDAEYITLVGGDYLVPHQQIIAAISDAHFGIVFYPPSPHTENSIPTKLYEYLAFKLPILLQDYRPWIELCLPVQAAICVNFKEPDIPAIIQQMREEKFYIAEPDQVTWGDEAMRLHTFINQILHQK